MSTLKRLDMRTKLLLLAGVFALGFVTFELLAFATLRGVQVNGPHYRRIVQNKDLVCDVLPPPAYIVETYLVANLLADGKSADDVVTLVARYKQLKFEYHDRLEYW